jgi:hypothetical protein
LKRWLLYLKYNCSLSDHSPPEPLHFVFELLDSHLLLNKFLILFTVFSSSFPNSSNTLLLISANNHLLPQSQNAVFAHIRSTQSFVGIGTKGIDHNPDLAKLSIVVINSDSHSFDDLTAAQTKNHVIATHITAIISFHTHIDNQAISILMSHHRIHSSFVSIWLVFIFSIIVTSTVDILMAKHMIAGVKIIQIRFPGLKYPRSDFSSIFSNKPNVVNNTIIGDNTIAIHIIHILIMKTTIAATKGIIMANI